MQSEEITDETKSKNTFDYNHELRVNFDTNGRLQSNNISLS